jgi:hypothetical protein
MRKLTHSKTDEETALASEQAPSGRDTNVNKPRDLTLQGDQLVGNGEQSQFQAGGNAGFIENIR